MEFKPLYFMNKELSKAIMNRTRLRNKFLKNENRKRYLKQRNYCVSLLRKTKRNYYSNLNEKNIIDNKKFWKTVIPFLSDKVPSNEKITLVENDEIITSEKETADVLNNFFSNIISNLDIPEYSACNLLNEQIRDPVLKAIVKYRSHPSVKAIQMVNTSDDLFFFTSVDKDVILREISCLDSTKACQETDVPVRIIKDNSDIFSEVLCSSLNASIMKGEFPSLLKYANIIPVYKKGSRSLKDNYRPISILPNVSKVYERVMFKQMAKFMDKYFSKFQCGFRKGYNTQQCLVALIGKWKSAKDKGKSFGAVLTDLSKAFDCLPHELILAKLHAYGFSLSALRLIQSYLSNRKQRTKINESYSSWEEILFGVPQGSILWPLLFNIFICDLFIIVDNIDFASFADDNTPYIAGNSPDDVLESLKNNSTKLFEWFSLNQMKANPDKCHLLMSTKTPATLKIGDNSISNSDCKKPLGVKIDSKLNFNIHLDTILKKASQKIHVLAKITPYMSINKRRLLMNSFFKSQFNYCPLVWMCHSRSMNNKINRLHERCLRIIYSDKKSSFEEVLFKRQVCLHSHKKFTSTCN